MSRMKPTNPKVVKQAHDRHVVLMDETGVRESTWVPPSWPWRFRGSPVRFMLSEQARRREISGMTVRERSSPLPQLSPRA
jgi:hypothetical protein